MSYYWLIGAAVFLAAVFFIRRLRVFVRIVYLKNLDTHTFSVTVSLFKRLKLYTLQISPPEFFQDKLLATPPQGTHQSTSSQGTYQSTSSQGTHQGTSSHGTHQGTPSQGSEYKRGTPAGRQQKLLRGKNNFSLPRKFWDKLAASLYFEKIRFVLTYGFDDAALTGVSNGLLAALRGLFFAVCAPYLKMKEKPDISFNPVYGDARLEIEFDCIFNIMLGNVIVIAASALIGYCGIFKKRPNFIQGGETQWRNILSRT